MHFRTVFLFVSLGVCSLFFFPANVFATYGASRGGKIPETTAGLEAHDAFPPYLPSPSITPIGTPISIRVSVVNPTLFPQKVTSYFRVYKLDQSPTGVDINDGSPGRPGISEDTLFATYLGGEYVLQLYYANAFTPFSLPSKTQTTLTGQFTPLDPGYYQFVYTTQNEDVDPLSGHIIATGFIRVLTTPGVTASPKVVATLSPTSEPTATPFPIVTQTMVPVASETPKAIEDLMQTTLPSPTGKVLGVATAAPPQFVDVFMIIFFGFAAIFAIGVFIFGASLLL